MLNEAKTSRPRLRPRPELRGQDRGQFLEVEAEAEAEAKNNYEKKYQIMINNIQFKIIAGKIKNIQEFYTIFARKMPEYIIRQRDRCQAEAKSLRPRPRPKLRDRGRGQILPKLRSKFWPRGQIWPRGLIINRTYMWLWTSSTVVY